VECTDNWRTKTRRERWIAFTPETGACLRRWRMQRKGKALVFAEEGDPPRKHYHQIKVRFDAAVTRSGIDRRTLQDLRRTVGSLLAARGVNQKVAAEILGHADIRTTTWFYQEVSQDTLGDTLLRLRTKDAG